jgi:hypothetical protein
VPGVLFVDLLLKEEKAFTATHLAYAREHCALDVGFDNRMTQFFQAIGFEDSSVGALFAAYLGREIRTKTFAEATRVLEPGGLLIWQGAFVEDFQRAHDNGFALKSYEWLLPQEVLDAIRPDADFSDPPKLQLAIVKLAKQHVPKWLVLSENEDLNSIPEDVKKDREIVYDYSIAPESCVFQKQASRPATLARQT